MKPCTLPQYLIDAGAICPSPEDCELHAHGATEAPPAPPAPALDLDDDDELPNTGT